MEDLIIIVEIFKIISKKTINFIKKYLAEKEDKDNYEDYKYKTNDEVNAIEEFEKTIVI